MWKHAPRDYGPPKTLYNRWKRWSRMGVFATIMTELSARAQDTELVMIDATHLKTHRTGSSLAVKKGGADG
jgi:transposase